jgi:cobalamin biosynthesis protein CobT
MPASGIYEALERGRLDAIGAAWLLGVAKNLLAHPGAENDGVRWLAFEVLGGHKAPREKTTLVEAVSAALPDRLHRELVSLAPIMNNHAQFAPAAASWATAAGAVLPTALVTPTEGGRLPLATREVVRHLPKRGDPGATSAPLRDEKRDRDQDGQGTATGNAGTTRLGTSAYHVYTTMHDRVVNAASLASRDELATLRAQLEAEFGSIRSIVARLAKRLMRVLMARQAREWRFDLDEGVLDGSRLAALVASGGRARPFKEESESPSPRSSAC